MDVESPQCVVHMKFQLHTVIRLVLPFAESEDNSDNDTDTNANEGTSTHSNDETGTDTNDEMGTINNNERTKNS